MARESSTPNDSGQNTRVAFNEEPDRELSGYLRRYFATADAIEIVDPEKIISERERIVATKQKRYVTDKGSLAKLIKGTASRCEDQDGNEICWRIRLEEYIYRSFDFDERCDICGHRNITVPLLSEQENANLPFNFQAVHDAGGCQCQEPKFTSTQSAIFDGVIGKAVDYHDFFTSSEQQKSSPDRAHGFKQSGSFNELLEKPASTITGGETKLLRHTISANGFVSRDRKIKMPSDAVCYPFLLVEAKAGNSRDSTRQVKNQIDSALYTFLRMQKELGDDPSDTDEHRVPPLVWCVMNRGPQWSVYEGYIDDTAGNAKYRANFVWSSNINRHDEALELLLILDLIAEWARSVLRPSILRRLGERVQNTLT